MKSHAQVTVVGGGCVGASILYGLMQHGCTDAVMLERSQLTAGSTWHAVGLKQIGQLRVANTEKRWDEFQSYISIAEAAGVPCRLLTPEEVARVHPLLAQSESIRGGILHDQDGYINPADITMGLARLPDLAICGWL